MQFTTFALSALSIGSALAAGTTVHVVQVGNANGSLSYSPNSVVAAVGDMVQFQFAPKNHTITQSTFDKPCQPIEHGIFSGFMPVAATSDTTPTFTIQINSTTPLWIYCSQGKHCEAGMVMVINENSKANATRTLDNYKGLAANAAANLPGSAVSNGTTGSTSASPSSATSGSDSSNPYATGSSTASSSSSSTSASSTASAKSAAIAVKPAHALVMGALLAGAMALLV